VSKLVAFVQKMERAAGAPKRGVTRFAEWWLGPPKKPSIAVCLTCRQAVSSWRTHANGRIECHKCASSPG
jgi:hypothetical protein